MLLPLIVTNILSILNTTNKHREFLTCLTLSSELYRNVLSGLAAFTFECALIAVGLAISATYWGELLCIPTEHITLTQWFSLVS